MLQLSFGTGLIEAGCDEAGRGCLAGPVFAAAVILPTDFSCEEINDSKQLSEKQRNKLRPIIENEALSWSVESVDNLEIDRINILNASILAMHKAVAKLNIQPEFLLVDGNRFKAYRGIPHQCIIKGDGIYTSIAAASILAKTHRDEFMEKLAMEYPVYGWETNKGYPTLSHRKAIALNGLTRFHRLSYSMQLNLW
jgi:ribonuclease HII